MWTWDIAPVAAARVIAWLLSTPARQERWFRCPRTPVSYPLTPDTFGRTPHKSPLRRPCRKEDSLFPKPDDAYPACRKSGFSCKFLYLHLLSRERGIAPIMTSHSSHKMLPAGMGFGDAAGLLPGRRTRRSTASTWSPPPHQRSLRPATSDGTYSSVRSTCAPTKPRDGGARTGDPPARPASPPVAAQEILNFVKFTCAHGCAVPSLIPPDSHWGIGSIH